MCMIEHRVDPSVLLSRWDLCWLVQEPDSCSKVALSEPGGLAHQVSVPPA